MLLAWIKNRKNLNFFHYSENKKFEVHKICVLYINQNLPNGIRTSLKTLQSWTGHTVLKMSQKVKDTEHLVAYSFWQRTEFNKLWNESSPPRCIYYIKLSSTKINFILKEIVCLKNAIFLSLQLFLWFCYVWLDGCN